MKQGKFEVFKAYSGALRRDHWFFRLKSGNGKIICQSEGYNSRKACMKGIAAIKRLAADAPVIDV